MSGFLTRSLLGAALLTLSLGASAQIYRSDPYGGGGSYRGSEPRYRSGGLIEQVQSHLDRAMSSNFYPGDRERRRFDNAKRHLWEFQERLNQGRFDKDRLDQAIGDIQHLVDHTGLPYQARDVLYRDLSRLREFRTEEAYRYRGRSNPYGYR
jgi:hypothetical protein